MFNDMAMALTYFSATSTSARWKDCGSVFIGQRLHGAWLPDGFFYFPMTLKDGSTAVCIASRDNVGPIIEN